MLCSYQLWVEKGIPLRQANVPAERRFTVGGSGKSVARCHRTVLAYWKFESISLQRRVNKLSVPARATRTSTDRADHRPRRLDQRYQYVALL